MVIPIEDLAGEESYIMTDDVMKSLNGDLSWLPIDRMIYI